VSAAVAKIRRASIATAELAPWRAGVPAPEDVLAGPVEMEIAVLWRSADGRSANGLFTSAPSRLRVVHPLDQTLVVLKGAVTYTEEGGGPLALGPGEALVIAAGARYVVEVTEPVEVFWTMTSPAGPIEFLD
jgi:uncharacterized cupin superfamily protein